jgi:hypothetical protein
MSNHVNDEVRKWTPERFVSGRDTSKSCCVQCGINHEARDFVRATLLHLLDHLERHDKFIEFMKITTNGSQHVRGMHESSQEGVISLFGGVDSLVNVVGDQFFLYY